MTVKVIERNNFEFVRLVAALLVIFGHSYALLGLPSQQWFGVPVHSLAVRVFFVVSGYLVCQSWNSDPNIARFFYKRLLRIYPALVAVVVITAVVLGPLISKQTIVTYFSSRSFPLYFWNIALAPDYVLPGVFEANPFPNAVNGSLWTLPFEVAMYLVLPAYGLRDSAIARHWLLPLALVLSMGIAAYVETFAPDKTEPVIYSSSIPKLFTFAPYFVAGAAASIWRLERFLNLQLSIALLMLVSIITVNDTFGRIVLLAVLPYAVLSFSLADQPGFAFLQKQSDISYGVYLWAFPIQQILIERFGRALSPMALFVLATILTLVPAYLSNRFVEQPAMLLKPKRRRSAEAGAVQISPIITSLDREGVVLNGKS